MTEILTVNKAFLDFECQKYMKVLNNLFVTDRDMVLPTKEQVKNVIPKVKLLDKKFDYDKLFCQHFGFNWLGKLIEQDTSDWCIGFGIKSNHLGILILDKDLKLHFISGQFGKDEIVEKNNCMFLVYLF